MQKQFRTFVVLFITLHLYSCNTKIDNAIQFEQLPSTIPVVLSSSAYGDNIYKIQIYTVNKIRKKTLLSDIKLLCGGSIHYKDSIWHGGLFPYYIKNNELELAENIPMKFFTTQQIAIAYSFFIDTSNKYYPFIKNDVERLKRLGQDTIHIGTIDEIKHAKSKFFNECLQVDSIALEFYHRDLLRYLMLPIETK